VNCTRSKRRLFLKKGHPRKKRDLSHSEKKSIRGSLREREEKKKESLLSSTRSVSPIKLNRRGELALCRREGLYDWLEKRALVLKEKTCSLKKFFLRRRRPFGEGKAMVTLRGLTDPVMGEGQKRGCPKREIFQYKKKGNRFFSIPEKKKNKTGFGPIYIILLGK